MPVNPRQDQIAAAGPLVMLNLNRYRERAEYKSDPPGGGSTDVSGREAYERYGEVALASLTRLGGEIRWHTMARMTVIGDDSDIYDEVIAVRYPSAQAFLELAMDADIAVALAHRDAGLERAALIWCEDSGS
jgi:hypothetical protein